MSDETLHIAISYEKSIDPEAINAFESDVAIPGLVVNTEERPESGPFASMEWLIPTAIIVFIGKAYFESFLSEAGKDHYHILKKAIVKLGQKFLGKNALQTTLVFTRGKTPSTKPQYSLVFSVSGEIPTGLTLKLLVEPGIDPADFEGAISAYISALVSIHEGTFQSKLIEGFDGAKPIGRTILVTYSPNESKLVIVDPLKKKSRHE